MTLITCPDCGFSEIVPLNTPGEVRLFREFKHSVGKQEESLVGGCVPVFTSGQAKMIRAAALTLLLLPATALAFPEKHYQEQWCAEQGGQAEVVLSDNTRTDCITSTHAIEFDFGSKWAEAIGQALYYGLQTGKRPGVVLILEDVKDRRYWLRLNSTIQHFKLPIDTWATGKGAY